MDAFDLAFVDAEVSIHKSNFGDVSWDVFKRSIVWFKIRKSKTLAERTQFMLAWEAA